MAKSNPSKRVRATSKFKKPRPDFPLFPHATGRWAKKVRGKFVYFGKCADDPKGQAAINLWLDQKDDLLAGRVPTANHDGLTVDELCQRFLHAKNARLETGELQFPTWNGYCLCCKQVIRHFGRNRRVDDLGPQDFQAYRAKLSKTNGLVGLKNQIAQSRMVFQFAYKADLVERPVKFGPDFSIPSARSIRKQRTSRMFEASEIRLMLNHGTDPMQAMVLLGINGGLGNADVERLNIGAIDFQDGWLSYPRVKTGAERRIPLWPETINSIRKAIEVRAKPANEDLEDRLFLTRRGESYHKDTTRYLTEQFRKFLQGIDVIEYEVENLYRKGVGFYALRHVFETIGGESRDQVAVDSIMGHQRGDMASIYRERISDERLQVVVETVRTWLFAEPAEDTDDEQPATLRFPGVG